MADEGTTDRAAAENTSDTFQRHGDPDPSKWEEQPTVTGRPNDTPIDDPQPAPLGGNTTFADRAKAQTTTAKQVDAEQAEDKAVTSAATKSKRARKS